MSSFHWSLQTQAYAGLAAGFSWLTIQKWVPRNSFFWTLLFLAIQLGAIVGAHLSGGLSLSVVFACLALYTIATTSNDKTSGINKVALLGIIGFFSIWFFLKYAQTLGYYIAFIESHLFHLSAGAILRERVTRFFEGLGKYPVVGLSFIGFKILHFIIDRRDGRIKGAQPLEVLSWLFFFPSIISGPIQRFQDWQEQRNSKLVRVWPHMYEGAKRIIEGAFLKFVLADSLYDFTVLSLSPKEVATLAAGPFTVFALIYTLYLYWDFAGYSSMAIGMGRFWGIVLPENFNFPLIARNLAEFWNRWHITLSQWLKDYLFYPLTLWMKRSPQFRKFPLAGIFLPPFIAFLIAGFWHGAAIGYLIFGALHGLGLGVIAFLDKKLPPKHPLVRIWRQNPIARSLAICFNYCYVSLSLVFFALPNESLRILFQRLWVSCGL